ncbi:MAG TPA: excinuclease ABC subunit UvrC [Polyangia bacterium]|nr:excinuclease ABC subunit UvrC [Polyangia bacterium]
MIAELSRTLSELPRSPGVYLLKDGDGRVIYVGKAKNLRARVHQYFVPHPTDARPSVGEIRTATSAIEVLVTRSEKEALLLEYNLIQRHAPRLNIRLRDGKGFLGLRLDRARPWPRLEIVRRHGGDDALYFGPYPSATAARETLRLVGRHFRLRTCADRLFANRVRPCLRHQMQRCPGPCALPVDPEEYRRQVEFVRLFLEGRERDLLREIARRMQEASGNCDYESAARFRDQLRAVEQTLAPQRITAAVEIDQDVIGLHREGERILLAVLEVREGRLAGRTDFPFAGQEATDEELLATFLLQRYTGRDPARAPFLPEEILLPRRLPDSRWIEEILAETGGRRVRLRYPRRGPRADQVRLADLNARQAFPAAFQDGDTDGRLARLQRRLNLPRPPRRIECVDIAHLAGTHTVGAIAVVEDGRAERRAGRLFKVRTAGAGDDYGAMAEVLGRRFRRSAAGEAGWEAPDLLVVDGGRGQLARARAVLGELGLGDQPVVALAKEHAGREGAEVDRVYLPGRKNPLPLRAGTAALHLLALARDEAHRLANSYQDRLRRRATLRSALDDVPGVGPTLRRALLSRLGSLRAVREASVEELAAVAGVGPALAARIRRHFSSEPSS